MGREAKINNKLTKKQNTFVKNILSGQSATQAALTAYNTSDPNVAKVIASENLTKPNIKEALDAALRTNGLTIDVITSNIGNIANKVPQKLSGDTVLKANVELLRLHGAYPDKKSLNINLSASFKTKLKAMSFQELRSYVEKMRTENDEIIKELEFETPTTTQNSLENS